MKLVVLLTFTCLFFFCPESPAQRCNAQEQLARDEAHNPSLRQKRSQMAHQISDWLANNANAVQNRSVITLPVVVHVVWKDAEENISDDQILSQLAVLNEDFRMINDNLDIVPEEFQLLITDIELEFCLAELDPDGNPSTGITRTQTDIENVGTAIANGSRAIFYDDNGGKNAWSTAQYINIWVARREFALGAATFPGQASEETDGIVIDPYYFGRTGLAAESMPFHLGKTLSHEMGHYFGLSHLNGPNASSDCNEDDGLEDTPNQDGTYLGECPTHPVESCGSNDMFMNIMSLTNDECLALFTLDQKMLMLANLNEFRSGLLDTPACTPTAVNTPVNPALDFRLIPNPAKNQVQIQFEMPISEGFYINLYSSAGSLLLKRYIFPPNSLTFDLKSFQAGIYIVEIRAKDYVQSRKLVILD
jgi:hypothetical protein